MKKIILCYDFDKTLTKEDILEYGFCKKLEINPADFWKKEAELMQKHNMGQIEAEVFTITEFAKQKKYNLTKQKLIEFGKKVEFFEGVFEWFEKINEYAKSFEVEIVHYIVSAGAKASITGTSVSKNFKNIYACEYVYGDDGNLLNIARIVDKTNKAYYIQKIVKKEGVGLNNVVYFGDGETDIPAFEFVSKNKGFSIGVCHPEKAKNKELLKMVKEKTLNHYFDADYKEESKLHQAVKQIIKNIYNGEIKQCS